MKRKNVVLATAAAAVLGVFNPAFAGGDSAYNKDSSASAESSVSGSTSADTSAGSDEKLTGLDRADQAAGDHGQQGRDNAREKQESPASSAASSGSGTALGDSTAGAEPERDAALESDRRLN
jgi:hypothetical protein